MRQRKGRGRRERHPDTGVENSAIQNCRKLCGKQNQTRCFSQGLSQPLGRDAPRKDWREVFWDSGLTGMECRGEDRVGSNPSSDLDRQSDLGKDYMNTLNLTQFLHL